MKWCALMVLAVGFLAAGEAPEKDAVKKEWKKLEGTWMVVAYENNGKKADDDGIKALGEATIKDGKYTWSTGGGGIMVIDPTKKPKQVDYSIVDSEGIVHLYKGIYELDGDTFKDCFALPDMGRPTEFKAPEGSNHAMMIHKRVKAEKDK